jgi:subtilisin family serine protease
MQVKRLWLIGMLFALVFAAVSPALAADSGPIAPAAEVDSDIIPGQFIVVMQDSATADDLEAAIAEAAQAAAEAAGIAAADLSPERWESVGVAIHYRYDAALNGFAATLPAAAVARLSRNPSVAYVEADRIIRLDTAQSPATWGLDRIDQRALPLNNTYNYNATGSGVTAYIIDTGIRVSHTQFGGRATVGYDAIGDGRNGIDCNGHGTHVAGTVGGSTYGVAKSVTLKAVRVLNCSGSGSTSGVIAGVNWVKSNARKPAVANMSLGGSASSSLDTAVSNSIKAGITYAVAAGNSNKNACNYSPARVATAITVGATTSSDSRASYSNYGKCLDLFAPGSSITSAWYTSTTAINTISGTSMATPHVAGVAALYLQRNPASTPAQVASALTANATANVVKSPGSNSPNKLLYSGFIP